MDYISKVKLKARLFLVCCSCCSACDVCMAGWNAMCCAICCTHCLQAIERPCLWLLLLLGWCYETQIKEMLYRIPKSAFSFAAGGTERRVGLSPRYQSCRTLWVMWI